MFGNTKAFEATFQQTHTSNVWKNKQYGVLTPRSFHFFLSREHFTSYSLISTVNARIPRPVTTTGKCRGRFQNSRWNSHIALALKFSEKKIPKRMEIGPLVSVPSSGTSGRISSHSGPDRLWAGRGGATASLGRTAQAPRGRRAGSGGGQLAREPGLRLAGNGSGCGTRRKPGWRLRAGRLWSRIPRLPRGLSPLRLPLRSRARERTRTRRRPCRVHPGLSWRAQSSASPWRTSCEWPQAAPGRE